MAKEIEYHLDILGQEVRVGNYVAAAFRSTYSSTLNICKVIRLTPKKVYLLGLKETHEWSVWPSETVKIDGVEAMAFILKYA